MLDGSPTMKHGHAIFNHSNKNNLGDYYTCKAKYSVVGELPNSWKRQGKRPRHCKETTGVAFITLYNDCNAELTSSSFSPLRVLTR